MNLTSSTARGDAANDDGTSIRARILNLRLPEQDSLRNEAERCSADPASLASIGRGVGHQVRIRRADVDHVVAVYTVSQANPDNPSRADVVRIGLTGRERLGTDGELDRAVVEARVVDAASTGIRFFEEAEDTTEWPYLVVIAPHGGKIEDYTDEQATEVLSQLQTAGFPASLWICKGFGDNNKGAFDRWHITSTDIHPASFPLLGSLMSRQFFYGIAFHGFAREGDDEADIYIGGAAPLRLKTAVRKALNRLHLPLKIKISTRKDPPKFQGFAPENLINRLAARGIHLEQSKEARVFHKEIADTVADVFTSHWRRLVWSLVTFHW
jgi:phage replication-related protein YjqB (UPF0714/DUF867 family)